MNREIKFRVWDIKNKEMLKVQELDFEPTFYGGKIAIRLDQYNDYFDTEDMILMQYTGIDDKNGKEIYEGDIVKYENMTGKIMFFNGSFIMSNFEETEEWELGVINEELEIMGNIYDNPELIGGE